MAVVVRRLPGKTEELVAFCAGLSAPTRLGMRLARLAWAWVIQGLEACQALSKCVVEAGKDRHIFCLPQVGGSDTRLADLRLDRVGVAGRIGERTIFIDVDAGVGDLLCRSCSRPLRACG